MDRAWKWKIGGIAVSVLLGIYALLPTLFQLPEKREALKAEGAQAPWYYEFLPEKGLNLGLDLRGGIYVEMEVLAEEGLKTKLDLLGQEIEQQLKKRNAAPVSWSAAPDASFLEFRFADQEALTRGMEWIRREYTQKDLLGRGTVQKSGTFSARFPLQAGYADQLRKDTVAQAVEAVRNRIDRYGLAEPSVQRQGETRLVVELPGVKDPERALKIIMQAGKLEFKLVNPEMETAPLGTLIAKTREEALLPAGYTHDEVARLNEALGPKLPADTEVAFQLERDRETTKVTRAVPYLLDTKVYVTGEMIKNAQVQFDPQSNQPHVRLLLNAEGAKNFAEVTRQYAKKRSLAILLDGNVSSAPWLREPILNGECIIEFGIGGSRDEILKEAKDLTLVLQEGALPARLKEATKTVIGPTLGADSIQKSLYALIVGALLVVFFMLVYYRLSGILANFALIVNGIFIFALLAMFQATLTLPGMAGIVLTIGMAVDANILIFERIREELRAGQKPRDAVAIGYSNATRAILDSNLTTVIVGIILYNFGTGPIRGFAVTLIIGLVCNLFTAVIMTRTIYDYLFVLRRVERLSI